MKVYNQQSNVGTAKYLVNWHDGEKSHRDGSPFFDVAIFRSRKAEAEFAQSLRAQGYIQK